MTVFVALGLSAGFTLPSRVKIMFVLILRLLQVESPIICPLLEKMDEHGLFVVENL